MKEILVYLINNAYIYRENYDLILDYCEKGNLKYDVVNTNRITVFRIFCSPYDIMNFEMMCDAIYHEEILQIFENHPAAANYEMDFLNFLKIIPTMPTIGANISQKQITKI